MAEGKHDLFESAELDLPEQKSPALIALINEDDDSVLACIISAIGRDATKLLCENFGGLPKQFKQSFERVSSVIGEEKTQALLDVFGKEIVYIPRRPVTAASRKMQARQLRRAGRQINDIALDLDITARQVYNYLRN